MKEADDEGYILCASTPGTDEFTEKGGPSSESGLVPGHGYSVIAAREYKEQRLLNIRNPWGSFEWGGDWCDSSKLWTEEAKVAINPVLDEEDGQFWMSYSDFLQRFNSLVFCKVRKWHEVRLRGAFVRTSTEPLQ